MRTALQACWNRMTPLLLAAVAGVFFIVSCARQGEVPPREVLLSDLERIGEGLHVANDPEPFTGVMVERYSDGTLKSRSEVAAGRLHGVSEGWYPDGTLQVREHFVAGVSHGLRTRWHANGTRASEAELHEGKLHGVFRRWHENGVLAEQTQMRGGEPHGDSAAFFESGYVRAQARLVEGRVIEQTFWQDGERPSGLQPGNDALNL